MFTQRFDTFEDEAEISKMIQNLQTKGAKYLSVPDQFWREDSHKEAISAARAIGETVMSAL